MPSREKKESTGLIFCAIFKTQPMVAHFDKIARVGWWQVNVYNMHGYTAAWILPEGIQPEGLEVIPCFETDGENMDVYIACR